MRRAIFDDNSNMAMSFSNSIDFILKAKPDIRFNETYFISGP
jgi:hypothetical protein